MKAKIRWYKNHSVEEKKKFLSKLEGSLDVLERLKEILEGMYTESLKESENAENYSLPEWGHYQADQIGKRRTLRELIDLVTLTED